MSPRLNKFLLSVALLLSQASALNWTLHNSDNGKNLRATGDRAGYSNADALIAALNVSALQPSKTIFAAVSDDASFIFPSTVVGLEAFHNERMARHAVKADLPAVTACIVRKLFSPDQEDRHPMFSDVRAFSINVLADSGFVFTFYFNSPDLRLNLDSYMSRLEFGLSFTSCMPGSTPEMRNRLQGVYVQLNQQLLDRQASGSLGNLGSILNIPSAPAQAEVVQVTQPSLSSSSSSSTQPPAAAPAKQTVVNPAKADEEAQAALEELLKGSSAKKTLTKKEKEAEKRRLAAEKQIKEAETKRRNREMAAMGAEEKAMKRIRDIERAREGQRRKEEEMKKAAAEAEAKRREEEERRRAKAEKKKVSPASSVAASPAASTAAAEIPIVKMPVHNPANVVTEAIPVEAKPAVDQAKPIVQVKSSNAKAVVAESKTAPQAKPVAPAKPAAIEAKPVEPVAQEKTSPQAATSKPKPVYVNSSNAAVKTSPQGKPAASEHRTVTVTEQKQKYIPPAARIVTVQPSQQQPQQQKYSPQGSKAVTDQKYSPQDSRAASTEQQKFSPKAAPQEAANNSNQFKSRQQKQDRNAHRQVAMTSPVEKSATSQVSRAASAEDVVVPAVVPVVMPVTAPVITPTTAIDPPPGLSASNAQPEKQENFDELLDGLISIQETVEDERYSTEADELTFGDFAQQSEASVVELPPAAPVLTIPIAPALSPEPQPAAFEVNWTPYTNGYSLFGDIEPRPEPVQVPQATLSFDEALQQFSAAAASMQQQQLQPLSIDISDSHLRGNVVNGLYSPFGLLPTRAQEGSGLLSSSSSGSSADLSGLFGPFPSSLTSVQSPLFGSVSAPVTSVAPPRSSSLESSASAPSTFSLFSEPANQTPRRDPWADFEARNSFLNPTVPPFSPARVSSNGFGASGGLSGFSSSSQGSSSGLFGTSAVYPSHSFGGSSYHQPQPQQQQQQQQQPRRAPSQQQQSSMHMQYPNQRGAYGEQRFYRHF